MGEKDSKVFINENIPQESRDFANALKFDGENFKDFETTFEAICCVEGVEEEDSKLRFLLRNCLDKRRLVEFGRMSKEERSTYKNVMDSFRKRYGDIQRVPMETFLGMKEERYQRVVQYVREWSQLLSMWMTSF